MDNLKKQRKKYIIISILIATIIVVAITALVGYIIYFNLTQTSILKDEIANLTSISSIEDIDMTIKTKGDYSIVEKKIKEYYNDMLTASGELLALSTDEKMTKLFTQENYDADGPKYTETIKFLSETKENTANLMDKMIELSSEEYLMNLLNDSGLNPIVVAAYKNEMYTNINTELLGISDKMESQKELMVELLDNMLDTLKFLSENSNSWKMQNNQLYFSNEAVQNEFVKIYDVMVESARNIY